MASMFNVLDLENYVREYMREKIKAKYPHMDTGDNSVFDDIFVKPMIAILSPVVERVSNIELKSNLKYASVLTDEEVEDIGVNNYAVFRRKGDAARVVQTYGFSHVEDKGIIIPEGAIITDSAGLSFVTTESKRLSKAEAKRNYNTSTQAYDVDVSARAMGKGSVYNVGANTLTIVQTKFSEYIAYTTNHLAAQGGRDDEAISDYINRVAHYYVNQHLGTEPGYKNILNEAYPNLTDVRVLGKDDEGMERDVIETVAKDSEGNTIFREGNDKRLYAETVPKHVGGCVDIYVRGSEFAIEPQSVPVKSSIFEIEGGIKPGSLKIKTLAGEDIDVEVAHLLKANEEASHDAIWSKTEDAGSSTKTLIYVKQLFASATKVRVDYVLLGEVETPVSQEYTIGYSDIEVPAPLFDEIISAYYTVGEKQWTKADYNDWISQIQCAGFAIDLPGLDNSDEELYQDFSGALSVSRYNLSLNRELVLNSKDTEHQFDSYYIGSSQERAFLKMHPKDNNFDALAILPNNAELQSKLSVCVSYNKTLKDAHQLLYNEDSRIITADVLVKEADRTPVNVGIAIRMKGDAEITSMHRAQIYATVESLFFEAGIGGRIEQSDIVGKLYTDATTAGFIEYVRLPLSSFYTPGDASSDVEAGNVSGDYIKAGVHASLYLNKLSVVPLRDEAEN